MQAGNSLVYAVRVFSGRVHINMIRRFGFLTVCSICLLVTHSARAADEHYLLDDPSYRALLFGEVDYRQTDGGDDDGFTIGQLVGQLNIELDSKLSVFTELTATARQDEDYEFEVERMFIRYNFSDMYKLSAGRFHTPIGYWNTAYHHGAWLQTTINRPDVVKFGSDVIPIHFVGVLLEGKLWQSNFGYRLGYGNGRCEEINDPCDLGDDNSEQAYLAQIYYRPLDALMLDTGLTVYADKVTPDDGPEADELIVNGYLALQGDRPELITEYTYEYHELTDAPGTGGSTNSVYAQVAYRLGGKAQHFKPYIRGEYLDVSDDDALLGYRGLDYQGVISGVRWDFSRYAALKAEVRREEFDSQAPETSFWLQLSFVFDPRVSASERRRMDQDQRSLAQSSRM